MSEPGADTQPAPRIPVARPDISQADLEAVGAALTSGWLSKGPQVTHFEQALQERLEVAHVVACSSGSAALHLAMLAAGVRPGDEVVVPSLTFCATANAVLHCGATPRFADIDGDSLCVTAASVEATLTERTRAVIPVHFGGHAADMGALASLCSERGLLLVDDAAHAFGTRWGDRPVSALADISCLSFYATKNITTGEGGAVCTGSSEVAAVARRYSWHGIGADRWDRMVRSQGWRYTVLDAGFKYTMGDPAAALGLSQLVRADAMLRRRTEIAERYLAAFAPLQEKLGLPSADPREGHRHAWHLFVVRVLPPGDRDTFMGRLDEQGISTSVHYQPLHQQPAYRAYLAQLPQTERVAPSLVSLPLYSGLNDAEVERVVDAVTRAVTGAV